MSGESRDDGEFGEAAGGSDGGAASAGEIVAIGAADAFDDTELTQTGEAPGEGCGGALGDEGPEISAAQAGDVEARTLQGGKEALFGAAEKIEAVDPPAFDGTGLGETVERPDAGREVIQTGEVFEITAIAAEQDLTQVLEAVDGLSEWGEGAGCRTLPMFYRAVVLESGDVVGGGLQAQDEADFVVDLDRGFAETMLDAGPFDPGSELATDLLGELGGDLVAEEGGDMFGFDGEDGLPGELFVEGFEEGWRAEHQISGVLYLHETPVVGLAEDVEHRTALLGIAIEDAMQRVGGEAIGEGLRARPIVDAQEGIVGKGEADPGGGELAGQPAMPVAIELEAERTPEPAPAQAGVGTRR